MPSDDANSTEEKPTNEASEPPIHPRQGVFSTPTPIAWLFDRVPLLTYPPNELPLRAPVGSQTPTLYVFTTPEGALRSEPSFNPSCLKWQTFLKILDIPFSTVPSTNHASPSGALPFLLPASSSSSSPTAPIPSSRLQAWAVLQTASPPPKPTSPTTSARLEAYTALLDTPIRLAYLHALYLNPAHFSALATPLYVTRCSRNRAVQLSLAQALRAAAEQEVVSCVGTRKIDIEALYRGAEKALDSLSTLLGAREWFEDGADGRPGLLDAAVFAYTWVLMGGAWLSLGGDAAEQWRTGRLFKAVMDRKNLPSHAERVMEKYFPDCEI